MSNDQSSSPHDLLVRQHFAAPREMASLLQAFVDPRVLGILDLASLERIPSNVVDSVLGDLRGDLAFRVRIAASGGATPARREAILFVHLEHQSTHQALMPYRLLRYALGFQSERLRSDPEATRIPAVLPIVLYNGLRPWRWPTRYREILDLIPQAIERLDRWVPEAEFLLVDLRLYAPDELERRLLAGTAACALAILFLRFGRDRALPRLIHGWGELIRRVQTEPDGKLALSDLFTYLLKVAGITAEELIRAMRPNLDEETEATIVTAAQRLIEQGRLEGRDETLRETLGRLLRGRFGPIGDTLESRLAGAGRTELDAWFDRAIDARSLDEVFGPH